MKKLIGFLCLLVLFTSFGFIASQFSAVADQDMNQDVIEKKILVGEEEDLVSENQEEPPIVTEEVIE